MDSEAYNTFQFLGIMIFQKGVQSSQMIGICGAQISTSDRLSEDRKDPGEAEQDLGIVLYQKAKKRVFQGAGLRLFVDGTVKRGSFLSITVAQKESALPVVPVT